MRQQDKDLFSLAKIIMYMIIYTVKVIQKEKDPVIDTIEAVNNLDSFIKQKI